MNLITSTTKALLPFSTKRFCVQFDFPSIFLFYFFIFIFCFILFSDYQQISSLSLSLCWWITITLWISIRLSAAVRRWWSQYMICRSWNSMPPLVQRGGDGKRIRWWWRRRGRRSRTSLTWSDYYYHHRHQWVIIIKRKICSKLYLIHPSTFSRAFAAAAAVILLPFYPL